MKKRSVLAILILSSAQVFAAQVLVRPSQAGRATDTMIFSDQATSFSDPNMGFQVRLNVSCFRTNLRSVTNPISPTGAVRFALSLSSGNTFSLVFPGWLVMNTGANAQVVTPPPVAVANGTYYLTASVDPQDVPYAYPGPAQPVRTRSFGNTLIFNTPVGFVSGVPLSAAGDYTYANYATLIQSVTFVQQVSSVVGQQATIVKLDQPPSLAPWKFQKIFTALMSPLNWISWGSVEETHAGGGLPLIEPPVSLTLYEDVGWYQPRFAWYAQISSVLAATPANPSNYVQTPSVVQQYMGTTGPLTGSWQATWSNDFKVLNVNASFPGQVNYCGGFFSPLMLFFDSKEPQFNRFVDFKMSSYSDQTYWPEPETKAAFLVLDRNGDGIINDVTEMFGSEDSSLNGFELLAAFDENGDGVIDAKDPVYSQLRLWTDSTGKAITLKKDLKTLKEAGVESISLNYNKSAVLPIDNRAELRERSSFTMVKDGKRTQGEVIDVWFANKR